jgi:hypothetical protein
MISNSAFATFQVPSSLVLLRSSSVVMTRSLTRSDPDPSSSGLTSTDASSFQGSLFRLSTSTAFTY